MCWWRCDVWCVADVDVAVMEGRCHDEVVAKRVRLGGN